MQNKKCAVFDLDGTLINTITDLGNACDYVIKKHGYSYRWSEDDYKHFVGNGMRKLVERAFDHSLDEEKLNEYLTEYKAYYNSIIFEHTAPYEGISEQLVKLKEKGVKLAVVTNKAQESAEILLDRFFGKGFFDVITGQRDFVPTKPNPQCVFETLNILGCTGDEALYFGDSDVDMITARNAEIQAVGVTWGFRGYDELKAYKPYKIIDSPLQIYELFK